MGGGNDMQEKGAQMDTQKTARIFGWLFIGTFITAIGARLFFVNGLGATWQDLRFIPGAGSETRMYLGAILEFGVYENMSGPALLMALPEIAWEASLGIYAAWKGFRPSPILTEGVVAPAS